MATPALYLLGVARVGQLHRVDVAVAMGATEFAVHGVAKNLLIHKDTSLAPPKVVTDKVRVGVTLLARSDFVLPQQRR
jgi:hypothetical protein